MNDRIAQYTTLLDNGMLCHEAAALLIVGGEDSVKRLEARNAELVAACQKIMGLSTYEIEDYHTMGESTWRRGYNRGIEASHRIAANAMPKAQADDER